jgi:hypothetical protein
VQTTTSSCFRDRIRRSDVPIITVVDDQDSIAMLRARSHLGGEGSTLQCR